MKHIAILLIVIIGVCACSQREDAQGPQRALARRLTEADRVVFSNLFNNRVTLTLSNKEVRKIVRALKASEEISPNVDAALGYALVFFRGTNHLATVRTSQIIFWIDGRAYEDTSGTLETAYGHAAAEQHRRGLAP
jgi:hypothetical protein